MTDQFDLRSDVKVFEFWIYLMTDLIIFAALFASYIVLYKSIFGGPSAQEIFEMPKALQETLILLLSSFTCAMGMLAIHKTRKKTALCWFAITVILGISFLTIEILEFTNLIKEGHGPNHSAFLSSFFALVGTHGLHISIGLIWMGVEMLRIFFRSLSEQNISRIFRMVIFWHFLDFVWIFIFTIVYGMGHLS